MPVFHHLDVSLKGCVLSEDLAGDNWAQTIKDSLFSFFRCPTKFWLGKEELQKITKHKSILRVIHGMVYVALVTHVHY